MPANMAANTGSVPSRKKTAYCCVLLFLFISAVCQITGLIAPWWMIVTLDETSIGMGLFFTTICFFDTCQTEPTDNFVKVYMEELQVTADDLNEYRTMTIIATLMCTIALSAMSSLQCCCTITAKRLKICLLVVVLGLVLSGSLSMAAAGKLRRAEIRALENLSGDYVLETPYALILTGVGGLISALLLFPMAVHTYFVWNQGETSPQAVTGSLAGPPARQSNSPAAGDQMTFYSPVYSVTPTAPPMGTYNWYNPPNYDQHNYPTFPIRPPIQTQPVQS